MSGREVREQPSPGYQCNASSIQVYKDRVDALRRGRYVGSGFHRRLTVREPRHGRVDSAPTGGDRSSN